MNKKIETLYDTANRRYKEIVYQQFQTKTGKVIEVKQKEIHYKNDIIECERFYANPSENRQEQKECVIITDYWNSYVCDLSDQLVEALEREVTYTAGIKTTENKYTDNQLTQRIQFYESGRTRDSTDFFENGI